MITNLLLFTAIAFGQTQSSPTHVEVEGAYSGPDDTKIIFFKFQNENPDFLGSTRAFIAKEKLVTNLLTMVIPI